MNPFGNDRPAGARVRGRARGALVALVAVGALLAGCTSSSGSGGDGGPTPVASPAPVVDPPTWVRSTGVALTSGALTVTAAAGAAPEDGTTATPPAGPPLTVETQADGTVTTTAQAPAGTVAPVVVATLAAPDSTAFDVQSDGSVLVRDAAGAILGGLDAPTTAVTGGASGAAAGFAPTDDGLLALTLTARTAPAELPATTVTTRLATVAVDRVEWTDLEDEGGRSLAVFPSAWGRTGQLAAVEAGWAQVVALAPDADTTGMHDQFVCHTIGAPDKESWNLEPWRPEVGSLATLLARCNP